MDYRRQGFQGPYGFARNVQSSADYAECEVFFLCSALFVSLEAQFCLSVGKLAPNAQNRAKRSCALVRTVRYTRALSSTRWAALTLRLIAMS
jgi:hypothetical protein